MGTRYFPVNKYLTPATALVINTFRETDKPSVGRIHFMKQSSRTSLYSPVTLYFRLEISTILAYKVANVTG